MVRCLDGDNIGEEVGPQQQAERAAGMGTLGPPRREGQHRELLFGTQQHQLWPEDHAAESAGGQRPAETLLPQPPDGTAPQATAHRAFFSR